MGRLGITGCQPLPPYALLAPLEGGKSGKVAACDGG